MSTLIVLLDGAADDRIEELGSRTPLEATDKRFIDSVASSGRFGCTDARGYTHLFMLEFIGGRALKVPRGVIEAMGYGVPLEEGEVAYRLSPAKLHDGKVAWEYQMMCEDEAKLRLLAKKHSKSISSLHPQLFFYCQGKGILKVRSDRVEELPAPPTPVSIKGREFGELTPFIQEMGSYNGGLVVMPWGGGKLIKKRDRGPLPSSKGMVLFSKSPSVLGVASYFGLENHEVSNYAEGLKRSLPHLAGGNVLWHIEETDDISHKRMPSKKVEMLLDVDRLLSSNKKKLQGHKVAFVIDHGTSSLSGEHLIMKVPFAVGPAITRERAGKRFCEIEEDFVPLPGLLDAILQ